MKSFFSIIIPAYNASNYIKECIKSIINQTVDKYEIIIVDDGSTDNTLEICEELQKKYKNIKVFHQENMGVVYARARGVKESKGEYLIFCDSDDMIHPETLESVQCAIDKTNADIITFKMSSNLEKLKRADRGKYYDRDSIEKNIFPYLLEDKKGNYFKPSICRRSI